MGKVDSGRNTEVAMFCIPSRFPLISVSLCRFLQQQFVRYTPRYICVCGLCIDYHSVKCNTRNLLRVHWFIVVLYCVVIVTCLTAHLCVYLDNDIFRPIENSGISLSLWGMRFDFTTSPQSPRFIALRSIEMHSCDHYSLLSRVRKIESKYCRS